MKRLSELNIHHSGYIVKDMDVTLEKLINNYGLIADEVYAFVPNHAWVCGKEVSDYELKIAMIKVGCDNILEIIQPVKGDGVHQQFLFFGKEGIHHICFSVNDYDEWHEFFEHNDLPIIFEAEVEDDRFGYRRCFYSEDKDIGMMIEIKEEPYFRK